MWRGSKVGVARRPRYEETFRLAYHLHRHPSKQAHKEVRFSSRLQRSLSSTTLPTEIDSSERPTKLLGMTMRRPRFHSTNPPANRLAVGTTNTATVTALRPDHSNLPERQDLVVKQLVETLVSSQMLIASQTPGSTSIDDNAPQRTTHASWWFDYFTSLGSLNPDEKEDVPPLDKPMTEKSLEPTEEETVKPNLDLHVTLGTAIQRGDVETSDRVVNQLESLQAFGDIDNETLTSLFYLYCSAKRPFHAYDILCAFEKRISRQLQTTVEEEQRQTLTNHLGHMYKKLCQQLRFLDPKDHDLFESDRLVRHVVADLQRADRSIREVCYPVLVSSLVSQRIVKIGPMAGAVYNMMIEEMTDVTDGFLEHLLTSNRYFRAKDLPYPDVLRRLVDMGRRPVPFNAMNVLENLYPYADLEGTCVALQALIDLQSQSANDGRQYVVDIATLEFIGASAVRTGNVHASMLVWDAIDVMGHTPTEAVYENTALVFLSDRNSYSSAFSVMAEMEAHGFEISRAFVRAVSTFLRDSSKNLDIALEQFKELRHKGMVLPVGILNMILSAGAERGDIDRTLALLGEFPRNNAVPNADSMGFAFESLGRHLSRRTLNPAGPELRSACLEYADSFLTMMDEYGIEPNHHIIREYVELLCHAHEIDTASKVIMESVENEWPVCSKAIYVVSMANVKQRQDYEMARRIANCAAQPLPFLMENIEKHELRQSQALESNDTTI